MEIGIMHEKVNVYGTKEYAYKLELPGGSTVHVWGMSKVAVRNAASLCEAAPAMKKALQSVKNLMRDSMADHLGEAIANEITEALDMAGGGK